MSGTSSGTLGFPAPSQQPQPKVLVVWSEGKTSTVRADDEDEEAGQKDAGWKPLPFQYQMPINKYSTLHNIAVKRSAVRRGQKDIDNHRTTIAIPKSVSANGDCSNQTDGQHLTQHRHRAASSRREHNDFDAAAHMTSNSHPHPDVQIVSARQEEDHRTASTAALDQLELANKNEPVTDGVIRQLIDQIAQLQRANGFVANRKDAATQVEAEAMEVHEQPASATNARTARLQSAHNFSFKLSFDDDDDESIDDVTSGQRDVISDRLLAYKLRQATMLGHLSDYRRRIEELDVMKEMYEAQISKLHDEMARLRELLVECRGKERETQSIVSDLRISLADLQNLYEEHAMMSQLRDMEHRQMVEELNRKITQLEAEKQKLSKVVESSAGVSGCQHSMAYTPESVDLSTSSPSTHHAQPAPVVVDGTISDVDDGHRLTAVYVQSRKTTSRQDDVVVQCPSPAPGGSPSRSHHRHRETPPAVGRTLPHVIGNGDVGGAAAAAARQRVSFQVHAEPRSQSSTCIAAVDTRPPRRRTDADQHRTSSSVDDMRTFHAPDRSPKPPRRDARPVLDATANGAANSAQHDIKTALDEITSSSGQQTDSVD